MVGEVGGSKRDGRVSEAAGRGGDGKLSRADVKGNPIKYFQCCDHSIRAYLLWVRCVNN